MPQFRHREEVKGGKVLGQGWKAKGKLFKLHCLLHLDDGSFIFTNRRDMIKMSHVMDQTMACFGLIMHVGKDGKLSKTKAMSQPHPIAPRKQRSLAR
jgi:hypothetical protein